MIVDRVRRLATVIRDGMEQEKNQHIVLGYTSRRDELREISHLVARTTASWRLLVNAGVIPDDPPAAIGIVQSLVEDIHTQFSANHAWILDAGIGKQWERCRKACAELNEWLLQHWTQSATAKVPQVNEQFLGTLAKVPGHRAKVEALRQAIAKCAALASVLPSDQSALEQFHAAIEKVNKIWLSLDPEDFPPAVFQFLRKANAEGAPLDALTDEVVAWLRTHEAADDFVIRTKTAAFLKP